MSRKKGSPLNQLKNFKDLMNDPSILLEKMAIIAEDEILKAHSGSVGNDTMLSSTGRTQVEQKSDIKIDIINEKTKVTVQASGENYLFHEFGAGVANNRPREWGNKLGIKVPDDIHDIGTYGQGYGSNLTWKYRDEDDNLMETEGYKAVNGFGHAINRVVDEFDDLVKEVLDGE